MSFVSKVEKVLRDSNCEHFGFAKLDRPLSIDLYREWIAQGHHADMHYLAAHADFKEHPQKLAPRAQSAIVITKSYYPHPYGPAHLPGLRTALYSKGHDYHHQFKSELEQICTRLRADLNSHEFLCFTDSGPVLERDLAYRAGLGWIGKNTCLIHPQQGSLFFIGEILTTLDLNTNSTLNDFCGTCDRCIRACPTGAIEEPRKLNASKCISYWTIEAKDIAPLPLRAQIGDWFFGCDICQTVCPWNEKHHGKLEMQSLSGHQDANIEDLRWVLTSSNKQIAKALSRSPLSRARPIGLKRNALTVIGNRRINELHAEVKSLVNHPKLMEIAQWTLSQLTL